MKQQATQVFELRSDNDIELFTKMLRGLKERAPKSLVFQVAVTATRDVDYRSTRNGQRAGTSIVKRVLDRVGSRL